MKALRTLPLVAFAVILFGALVVAQQADDDAALATRYFDEINAAPYTEWGFEPNVPEGYYVGVEPHGMILRTFLNEIALQDTEDGGDAFSEGAIIVKENHMPGETDISDMEPQAPVEGFEGNLAALTYMVKIPGYNPEAGDWFWAKTTPDGSIDAAGKAQGCIACHSQAVDNDYVFNVGPAGN
ncbi:MAG: cytochrome P460 family protein [Trueperaceae bacterium]